MIDLSASIRTRILSVTDITSLLTNYKGSKPIFTRRPAPSDAAYPIIMISPMVGGGIDDDFLKRQRREVTYDLAVYGTNDTAENYRKVEKLGFLIAQVFHRLDHFKFETPEGWQLVRAKSFGPMPAPTDDQKFIGRMISVQFLIAQNTVFAVATP